MTATTTVLAMGAVSSAAAAAVAQASDLSNTPLSVALLFGVGGFVAWLIRQDRIQHSATIVRQDKMHDDNRVAASAREERLHNRLDAQTQFNLTQADFNRTQTAALAAITAQLESMPKRVADELDERDRERKGQ